MPHLATENLLENTNFGLNHQCSLEGGSLLPSSYADARCIDAVIAFKGVYLLPIHRSSAAITHLAAQTFYAGGHPTSLLAPDKHAGFDIKVVVDLFCAGRAENTAAAARRNGSGDGNGSGSSPRAPAGRLVAAAAVRLPAGAAAAAAPHDTVSGLVTVVGSWPGAVPVSEKVALPLGVTSSVVVQLGASQTLQALLWYPNNVGNQTMYRIDATFAADVPTVAPIAMTAAARAGSTDTPPPPPPPPPPAVSSRNLGFRHIALVTIDDTDPATAAAAADQDGTGQFTMFFRVNGAALYARGANKVPMDLITGRMTAEGHRRLVQSAAEGNFNMLRIWGGSIWEPRAFYDACDAYGILLYHDLQFGAKETYGWRDVPAELEFQIKRNAHHPSIAMWDSCNECTTQRPVGWTPTHNGTATMEIVARFDSSRPLWPASPGPGWAGGVDRLTARPNGKQLLIGVGDFDKGSLRPHGYPFFLESHGTCTAARTLRTAARTVRTAARTRARERERSAWRAA